MYIHRRGTQALSTPTELQDHPHNSTTPSPHLPRPLFTPRPSPSQHLPPVVPLMRGDNGGRCFISCAVSTGAAVMRDNINILLTQCLSWSRQFAAQGIPQVGRNTSHQDTPVLQIHGWKLLALNLNSVTSAGRVFAERGVFDFWWELLLSKTELIQCCCYTAIACKLAPRKMLEFWAGQLLSCALLDFGCVHFLQTTTLSKFGINAVTSFSVSFCSSYRIPSYCLGVFQIAV